MNANWYGLIKAFKLERRTVLPNREFAAVYCLRPLCPPGTVLHNEDTFKEFIPFEDLLNEDGRKTLQCSKDTPCMISKSIFEYPCGHLIGSNYPDALRKVGPSDEDGCNQGFKVNMAAIDLFGDRERGIQKYNEFRRQLHLPPFKSWLEMRGDLYSAKKLGPAPEGIEKCDLLVGDLYKKKLPVLQETSFIVFVLMATRCLKADPFLHEYYDKEHSTEFGLQYIFDNDGLIELLNRHYPDIVKPFVERGQSAFKPIYGPEKWQESIKDGTVDPSLVQMWKNVKEDNEEFFRSMMREKVEEEEGTRHVSFLDEESNTDIANETTKLIA